MSRWLRWTVVAFAGVAVVLSTPVLWVEGLCTAPAIRDPVRARLVDEPGDTRRESDSYLSFSEWHIVYAYEDLAGVLRTGDESDFAYGRQIAGFWRSLCRLNAVVSAREGAGVDTKIMLYTIGWSFTAELALKGAYETTMGRLFEWIRGVVKTDEDVFAARDMVAYAAFWRETPVWGARVPRKLERRAVFTME